MVTALRPFAPLPEGFTKNSHQDVQPEGHGFRNVWTRAFYSDFEEGRRETELFYNSLRRFQCLEGEPGFGGEGFWQCVLESGQKIKHWELPKLFVKYQERKRETGALAVECWKKKWTEKVPKKSKKKKHMGVSKNRGTPESSILIGFFIINHPFWGKTPYFWKHPYALRTIPRNRTFSGLGQRIGHHHGGASNDQRCWKPSSDVG